MGAKDLSIFELAAGTLILIIPIIILYYYRTGLVKATLVSFSRMILQMVLVGVYLKYVFDLNSVPLNILWVVVMTFAAAGTVLKRSGGKFDTAGLFSVAAAIGAAILANGLVFAFVQIGYEDFFNAWYIIPMIGMLLGNCIGSSVTGLRSFETALAKGETKYNYLIAGGATRKEALREFTSGAIKDAVSPSIAQTASIGLIWLPGMMTGQILGGGNPDVAIKYQIVIVTTIFVGSVISVYLSILFGMKGRFDERGLYRK